MDRLWSPWRADHVATFPAGGGREADGRTLFERLAASTDDAAALIVWRGAHVFALLNRYPYTNGHLLVVPYRAVADVRDLTADEHGEFFGVLPRALGWIERAFAPEGVNVGINLGGASGAAIPEHLHLHLVPRWAGDTNFLPVAGAAKVIPEALDVTYRRYREAIAACDGPGDRFGTGSVDGGEAR